MILENIQSLRQPLFEEILVTCAKYKIYVHTQKRRSNLRCGKRKPLNVIKCFKTNKITMNRTLILPPKYYKAKCYILDSGLGSVKVYISSGVLTQLLLANICVKMTVMYF